MAHVIRKATQNSEPDFSAANRLRNYLLTQSDCTALLWRDQAYSSWA